jgi:hypothetical protein
MLDRQVAAITEAHAEAPAQPGAAGPVLSAATAQRAGRPTLRRAFASVWNGRVNSSGCWWAVNQTPWPIWVECDNGRIFTLGPLERRRLDHKPRPEPLQRLIDRRQLVVEWEATPPTSTELHAAVRVVVIVVAVWLSWILIGWSRPWLLVGAALGVLALITLFLLATQRSRLADLRRARQWTWQGITMLIVLGVAVVAPALALGVGVGDFVALGEASTESSTRLEMTGRHLQLTLIAVAAMLPALLYFQFDAERLSTQRDRWLHTIFRIDPSLATIADVEAKYGRQLEEAYGADGDGRGRLTRGRRSPLIVATVTLTFGWLLILLGSASSRGAGTGSQLTFRDLLTPAPSVITFAFLGAYFFGLNLVYDGYVRGDLRPKTYHQITTRVLFVVIIAWLISVSFPVTAGGGGRVPEQVLYGMAFVAGITPRPVLQWVMERLPLRGWGRDDVTRADQLRSLDGIDLYERTRLSDEGIRTIQALAHSDLTDLFFKTRIASARLIDWLDQAVLQLYLAHPDEASDARPDDQQRDRQPRLGGRFSSRKSSGGVDPVEALRAIGIRTATDLLDALTCDETKQVVTRHLKGDSCRWVDDTVDGRLELLKRTLENSEWTGRVHYWRRSSQTAVEPRQRRWIDGDGNLRRGDPRFAPVPPRLPAGSRRVPRARTDDDQARLAG